MEMTENLNLPYLMPSQAQKHITHNEALRVLDTLVQLSVQSRSQEIPPADPQPGARYIVPLDADGWTGQAGAVAAWQDGAWAFHTPRTGWLAHVEDEAVLLSFEVGAWKEAEFRIKTPERLGINATADAPNRLAVAGAASLLTHEGSGHQLKINKATASDTASVLFQTEWSGRAEFGLAGDDDFHVKVSADGMAFTEAMVVSRQSGKVTFPAGVAGVREQLTANRTYYVSTTGSNTNDGLSTGAAFATLQKAVDEAHRLDCSIYNVTIRLADGTYAGVNISRPLFGGGTLFLIGNEATPANVVLTSGITAGGGRVSISGVKLVIATDFNHALTAREGARLLIGRVEFGQIGPNSYHITSPGLAHITIEQDYMISGGALRHVAITGPVVLEGSNRTITLTGTPAFLDSFYYAASGAAVAMWNLTVLGAATGKRYAVNTCGVVNTYGKPTTFLPGDAAGTSATGGIYA